MKSARCPRLRELGRRVQLDDGAAQLVEFAVALPLLVVFVVGIFDFSNAFTLKLRLTNLAREAAHASSSAPFTDVKVAGPVPISVADAFQLIDYYLVNNNVNDCGLSSGGTNSVLGLTWSVTAAANGCPAAGITLTVNRGYYFPVNSTTLPDANCTSQTPGTGQTAVLATCVSILYPYPWRFGQVASLLGSNSFLPNRFSAVAVAFNQD